MVSSMLIGSVTSARFSQVRHDVVSFAKRAEDAGSRLSVELKIDGVALSLEYRDHELVTAVTRGSGRVGDDITENVRAALFHRGVLPRLPDDAPPGSVVVRGEVYISQQDFEEVNQALEGRLSNARNAVAGALKHKDPEEAAARKSRFVAYECLVGGDCINGSNNNKTGRAVPLHTNLLRSRS